MTANADKEHPATSWLEKREAGTVLGIRLVLIVATLFGRAFVRVLTRCIAAYYLVFDRQARRASRSYLERVHSEPAGWSACYQHLRTFAEVTADRLFLLKGRLDLFDVERTGHDLLADLASQRRGAVLLGAHLGSFEILRVAAKDARIPINIVGYFRNAQMINSVLESLDPEIGARVIHVEPGSVNAVLAVKDRIDAGELVALLADRVGLNDRTVPAEFLGDVTAFPAGPFVLANLLNSPVYLTFGLYLGGNRYHLHCERFAERLELPRRERREALQGWVQKYATRLEAYCRRAPRNWFNFYDYWLPTEDR